MGFRFRKSVKIAPGVKLNLGKKGASVSVGKRGAKVTVGKTGVRTTVGAPGTGLSYTKHHSFNMKQNKTTSNQTSSLSSVGQAQHQQMELNTALKIIKWAFYIFLAFLILMMYRDSSAVIIGALVIITGMILTNMKKKGKLAFKQTWIVTSLGWMLTLILWVTNIEPIEPIADTPGSDTEINTITTPPSKETDLVPIVTDEPNEVVPVEQESEPTSEVIEEPETVSPEETLDTSQPVLQREYYNNCKEMNAVYPNGVPEEHPAYDSARDRDNDGWACER